MREMLSEFEEKPKEDETEDRLELSLMSKKERRKAKKAKLQSTLSDMTKKEKISYLVFYYKWPVMIGIIIFAFALSIGITIYKNSRPTSISYAVINCENTLDFNYDAFEKYAEDMGMTKGYRIYYDLGVYLDPEKYKQEYFSSNSTSTYIKFPLVCYDGVFDICITDKKGAIYCGLQDIFYPVNTYLPSEYYDKIDKDRLLVTVDHENDMQEFAIYIGDTEFAKSLNLGYDDVYLGFPGHTEVNIKSSLRFLNYIFDLGIELDEGDTQK